MSLLAMFLAAALRLTVSPQTGFEPLKVEVRVFLPLDSKNRELTIVALCDDDVLQASQLALDGRTDDPIIYRRFILPACDVALRAILVRLDGHQTITTKVIVLSRQ